MAPVPVSVRLASTVSALGTAAVGEAGEFALGELGELPPHAAINGSMASRRHGRIEPRTERAVAHARIGLSCCAVGVERIDERRRTEMGWVTGLENVTPARNYFSSCCLQSGPEFGTIEFPSQPPNRPSIDSDNRCSRLLSTGT